MSTCIRCDSTQNLVACNACNQEICRKHRVGLGDLSDGYTCLEHVGFGFPGFSGNTKSSRLSAWGPALTVALLIVLIVLRVWRIQ